MKGHVWFWKKMCYMTTCILLYSMITEDEREFYAPTELGREAPPPYTKIAEDKNVRFQKKIYSI